MTACRTALVVGATSGIGKATAERLVQAGWRVAGAGRRVARLEAMGAAWGPERWLPLALDVRDEDAVVQVLGTLPEAFAQPDALVYCAGLSLADGPLDRLSPEAVACMLHTNIHGLVTCVRAVLPGMRARQRGDIITVGSQSGNVPCPGTAIYGASKAFSHALSLQLREDLAGTSLRVTSIEPGTTATEFADHRLGEEQARSHYAGCEPLQAADVAEAIHWVLSCPPHVTVTRLQLVPTRQTCGKPHMHRGPFIDKQ